MLNALLRHLVHQGTLNVIGPAGAVSSYGAGLPRVTMRFHDRRAPLELALNPDFRLGQLYMDGRLTVENGGIADLLSLLFVNLRNARPSAIGRIATSLRLAMRHFSQFNPVSRAKAHVAHHYDLSDRLYEFFLDPDKQYSCAYFATGTETLEEAQTAKKNHIAAKLSLDRPGLKVLDIGCGWGGLALDLARSADAQVLGVTLSENQVAVARKRAVESGLAGRCRFELTDYRALSGRYDRIVSVGMFEHVGIGYYDAFFAKVRELLTDNGVMLLHTIGRLDGPGFTNPWIKKYIFPGGYTPALSEVLPAIEKSGLVVADVEVLRLHYAETLLEWRKRFLARRQEVAQLYDERFCRMWEFYLAAAEMTFRVGWQGNFQIQLIKDIDALPITRDYMVDGERALDALPAAHRRSRTG